MPETVTRLVQFGTNTEVSKPILQGRGARVTLTRCPVVVSRSGLNAGLLCPPLSNAYLAAAVREHGYTVTIIDPVGEAPSEVHEVPGRSAVAYGWPLAKIIQEIPSDTKYIGISCMFSHEWPLSKQLIELIRG